MPGLGASDAQHMWRKQKDGNTFIIQEITDVQFGRLIDRKNSLPIINAEAFEIWDPTVES
jgi:hypothetical protein|tara:strand:- start:2864 stop:3043 length:180 start_codon:yes stop_codon:yes gene_type:complete